MADKHLEYSVPWSDNLRHRHDPNRVHPGEHSTVHHFWRLDPAEASLPAEPNVREVRAPQPAPQAHASVEHEPSYYDVPMLKRPVWKWQIATYFYLGGMSAGAYLIARVADRAAGDTHRKVTRTGTWVSLLALAPCPPLLIDDLGDSDRFHHMLRVFKPGSPMNLGTWTLVGYSGMLGASVLRELLRDLGRPPEDRPDATGALVQRWLDWHDLLGIPFAIGIAGYTGVLLSCTANPLWCRNPWLGPLFSASALSTGAEAVSLVLDCTTRSSEAIENSQRVLQRIDTVAHAAEVACSKGFELHAGEKVKPLKQGSVRNVHKFALGGLVAAEALKLLPVSGRLRKPVRMAAAALGLAAGFALRWSMIYGGKEAGDDPHLARLNSRRRS